jgi:hypothetical protein
MLEFLRAQRKNNSYLSNSKEFIIIEVAEIELKKELPENILNASDSAEKVEFCAQKLLKDSAIRVAKFEMDEVLDGKPLMKMPWPA